MGRSFSILFLYKHFCFILCIWVFCLHVILCIIKYAFWRSEEHLDPLELELGTVVSYYISARNQTQALWKKSQCSWTLRHLFSSKIIFLIALFPLFTFHTGIFLLNPFSIQYTYLTFCGIWARADATILAFSDDMFLTIEPRENTTIP